MLNLLAQDMNFRCMFLHPLHNARLVRPLASRITTANLRSSLVLGRPALTSLFHVSSKRSQRPSQPSKLSQTSKPKQEFDEQLTKLSFKLEEQIRDPETKPEIKSGPSSITENIYTLPNVLTFTRIISAPFVGYYIIQGQPMIAIGIFAYSSITDLVDGFIARRFNMQSKVGSIIDPMADKLLMTVCTVSLWYSLIMPAYLAFLIIGRDVMLSFMGFYYRYISLPPPKTISRYVDMSIVSVSVHPNMLSKVNTALQMFYIGGLVIQPGVASLLSSDHAVLLSSGIDALGMLVAVTTFFSGAYYVFSKKAIEFIKP